MIPLVTSMPPRFSRRTSDDTEIGREYALQCIQSWRNSGFDPVSVNAEKEPVSELIKSEAIRLITVKRDASDQFGKPLVYLGDFVAAACKLTDGPLVITNADILIDMPVSTGQAVSNLKPGQCLVSRRCDIQQADSRDGEEYTFGYDFFAFHTRDLVEFSDDNFVLGMPWWDHYLPIYMYLRGIKCVPAMKPFVFHLEHTERWEPDNWMALGGKFLDLIQHETSDNAEHGALAKDYARRFRRVVMGSDMSLISRLKAVLLRLGSKGIPDDDTGAESETQLLFRLADLNVEWLEEQGPRYT